MLTATWGKHFFKADATKCASEIMEICDQMESATPQQILEKARDESTELHKCFTWDDSIAAEKYRINRFTGWSAEIELAYVDNIYSIEQIVNIIQLAGFGCGIGSGRTSGYGRFHVE